MNEHETSPPGRPPARVRWLGHSTVLIELDGARLLTDPALGRWVGPLVRHGAAVGREHGRSIDAVLLSHLHADHSDLRSLRRVGRGVTVLAPAGAGAWLRRRGFHDVREVVTGETAEVAGLRVTATPARHDGRRQPFGPTADAVGFLVEGTRAVYFAGDTDLFEGMAALAGRVDLALIPVSGWGPTLPEGHLSPATAARAVALIDPLVAVPIHWGTLSLPGFAPRRRDRPAREFAAAAASLAPAVEVRILAVGESAEITRTGGRPGSRGSQ